MTYRIAHEKGPEVTQLHAHLTIDGTVKSVGDRLLQRA